MKCILLTIIIIILITTIFSGCNKDLDYHDDVITNEKII